MESFAERRGLQRLRKHDRIVAEVDALAVGESVVFKDYSEYFAIEDAKERFHMKQFAYRINDQCEIKRVA